MLAAPYQIDPCWEMTADVVTLQGLDGVRVEQVTRKVVPYFTMESNEQERVPLCPWRELNIMNTFSG